MSENNNRKEHLLRVVMAIAKDAVCWRRMRGARSVGGWIGGFE